MKPKTKFKGATNVVALLIFLLACGMYGVRVHRSARTTTLGLQVGFPSVAQTTQHGVIVPVTVTVGSQRATDIVMELVLPEDQHFVSATPAPFWVWDNTVRWTIGSLAAGTSWHLEITLDGNTAAEQPSVEVWAGNAQRVSSPKTTAHAITEVVTISPTDLSPDRRGVVTASVFSWRDGHAAQPRSISYASRPCCAASSRATPITTTAQFGCSEGTVKPYFSISLRKQPDRGWSHAAMLVRERGCAATAA